MIKPKKIMEKAIESQETPLSLPAVGKKIEPISCNGSSATINGFGSDATLYIQKATVVLKSGESYFDIRLPSGEKGSIWRSGKFKKNGVPWEGVKKNERSTSTFRFRRAVVVTYEQHKVGKMFVVTDSNGFPILDKNGERQFQEVLHTERRQVEVIHVVYDADSGTWVRA